MQPVQHIIKAENVKAFILAGQAIVTCQSSVSGSYFTYRITKQDKKDLWFVKVLINGDNENGYKYIGCLYEARGKICFKLPAEPKISAEALSVVVWQWIVNKLDNYDVLTKMYIRHEGYCCKCGRMLTDPESVSSGWGPVCAGRVRKEAAKKLAAKPFLPFVSRELGGQLRREY